MQMSYLEQVKVVAQPPVEALHGLARLQPCREGVQHGARKLLIPVHWRMHPCGQHTGCVDSACS